MHDVAAIMQMPVGDKMKSAAESSLKSICYDIVAMGIISMMKKYD